MGKLYLILIAIMVFISVSLSGIFAPPFPPGKEEAATPNNYLCCDTGDGDKCKPILTNTFPYNGKTYALLKSNILPNDTASHANKHMAPVGRVAQGRIFKLIWEKRGDGKDISATCRSRTADDTDWLIGPPGPEAANTDNEHKGKGCYAIPNELLLYICDPAQNDPGECDQGALPSESVEFNAYIRVEDILPGGRLGAIPYPIHTCVKPPLPPPGERKIVFRPSPDGQPNLQLRTFKFVQDESPLPFLAPYCKPAIYLYPERKSEINVSVYPQGEMLLTIPQYPKNGWDVVAEPNGDIFHQNKRFDYLYYEAALPDQLIPKPKEGYVMDNDERALFLTDLVTKLGLNEKETKQFVEYWVPILPKAPYYFVGIVPLPTLNEISPVLITPKPDNLIRVTLYFQPLEEKISVTPPLLPPVSRDGYTAVEWGGIFKQDKDHPFSCFM